MQAREVAACGHAAGNQGPDGCRGLLTRAQAFSHTEMPSTIGVSRGSYPSSQSVAAPPPEGEEDSPAIARGIGEYTPGLDTSAADSQIRPQCILSLQLHSQKSPTFCTSENELLRTQAHKGFHITGAKSWPQATYGPQMCFMGSTHSFFKNVSRLPTFNCRKFRIKTDIFSFS